MSHRLDYDAQYVQTHSTNGPQSINNLATTGFMGSGGQVTLYKIASGAATQKPVRPRTFAEQMKAGKKIYSKICYKCHMKMAGGCHMPTLLWLAAVRQQGPRRHTF